jgi:BirA family biotin operon repressor/biotin-[acetyl-CoA-carboxylase] ligase
MSATELEAQVRRSFALLAQYHPRWDASFVDETNSTSSALRELLEAGHCPQRPQVLVAGHQTGGRGRGEKKWLSAPGKSLLFTAAIPLELLGAEDSGIGRAQPRFPITLWPAQVAMGLNLRLRQAGFVTTIKWPNDLIVDGGKVGGILCEQVQGWLLAGVGLNLTQGPAHFEGVAPARYPAKSLGIVARDPNFVRISPVELVPSLLQAVVTALEAPWPTARLLHYYREWSCTLGEHIVAPAASGGTVEGIAVAIADDGALMLETGNGSFHTLRTPLE